MSYGEQRCPVCFETEMFCTCDSPPRIVLWLAIAVIMLCVGLVVLR